MHPCAAVTFNNQLGLANVYGRCSDTSFERGNSGIVKENRAVADLHTLSCVKKAWLIIPAYVQAYFDLVVANEGRIAGICPIKYHNTICGRLRPG
jgi:hypothetical protein